MADHEPETSSNMRWRARQAGLVAATLLLAAGQAWAGDGAIRLTDHQLDAITAGSADTTADSAAFSTAFGADAVAVTETGVGTDPDQAEARGSALASGGSGSSASGFATTSAATEDSLALSSANGDAASSGPAPSQAEATSGVALSGEGTDLAGAAQANGEISFAGAEAELVSPDAALVAAAGSESADGEPAVAMTAGRTRRTGRIRRMIARAAGSGRLLSLSSASAALATEVGDGTVVTGGTAEAVAAGGETDARVNVRTLSTRRVTIGNVSAVAVADSDTATEAYATSGTTTTGDLGGARVISRTINLSDPLDSSWARSRTVTVIIRPRPGS